MILKTLLYTVNNIYRYIGVYVHELSDGIVYEPQQHININIPTKSGKTYIANNPVRVSL